LTRFNKPYQKALITLAISVAAILIVLSTSPKKDSPERKLNTAIQMIENTVTPLLLSERAIGSSPQLAALIQDTPIAQVRLIEPPSTLLARALNVSEPDQTRGITTSQRSVKFEGHEIGILEIDTWSSPQTQKQSFLSWSVFAAFIIGGVFTLALSAQSLVRRYTTETVASEGGPDNGLPESISSRTHLHFDKSQLLVVIKTGKGEHGEELSNEGNSELAENIQQLADLYNAELFSISSHQLCFKLAGKSSRQHIQHALVFAWGITQLSSSQLATGESTPPIQSYVIDDKEIDADPEKAYSYLIELENLQSESVHAELVISSTLAPLVDEASFVLDEEGNRFSVVKGASIAIRRLWDNQRSRLKH